MNATSTNTVPVAPSNADALQAWDGDDGAYWADNERIFDGSVARYDPPFLAAAAIEPGDLVLDIGCGTGRTTRDAARAAPNGSALGVDLSSAMIERARRRAADEGLGNARFLQADAQIHPFDPGAFTVAVSRTGAMFFGDPVAAFTNIARAVCPGGRLALLVWQPASRNPWFGAFAGALAAGRELPIPPPDAPGPFSWGDPDRARRILTKAGFAGVHAGGIEAPMYFGDTADEAYRFVLGLGLGRSLLAGLDDDEARARARDALRATIDAHQTADGVLYPSATWIVTARRDTR
jgi:SAM-dependent methyltransferase